MCTTNTLISVIVPVYNVEAYLRQCIDSIIGQTYRDLEIILVNDGSTDRSGDICDEYVARDPRIKVLHKTNGGLSSARNAGMEVMTGDFFTFVDSDDWIALETYQVCISELSQDTSLNVVRYEIVFTSEIEQVGGQFIRYPRTYNHVEALYACARSEILPNVWSAIYNTRLFGKERFTEGILAEDVPFTLAVCSNPLVRLRLIPSLFYFYRTDRAGALSKKAMGMSNGLLYGLGIFATSYYRRENQWGGGDLCIVHHILQEIGRYRDMQDYINPETGLKHLQVINECIALLRPSSGYSLDAFLTSCLRYLGARHFLKYGRFYEIAIRRLGLKSHLYPYYYNRI